MEYIVRYLRQEPHQGDAEGKTTIWLIASEHAQGRAQVTADSEEEAIEKVKKSEHHIICVTATPLPEGVRILS